MRIERNDYIEAIKPVMHNGLVKVVTGVRRCGKSYFLFHIFRDWLHESGVEDSQVIAVQLDDDDFSELRTPRALSRYIKERLQGDGRRTYVLIDEIQECKPPKGEETPVTFYDVLNSLMKKEGVDIYVTGSNSEMLSEDIATNFRDRGTVIRMWPLSFAEFLAFSGSDKADAWEDYLVWGGMPLAVLERRRSAREAYLRSLFERVYLADIVERYGLRNRMLLDRVCDVVASSVGGLTSPGKLARSIVSELGIPTDERTVNTYLDCLRKSFLFEKADRWDVKGRKYLGAQSKYYAEDCGLRNARLNFRQVEQTHLMENALYCELLRRGYAVDVGVVPAVEKDHKGKSVRKNYEIDFVVNVGFQRIYIQSALSLDDDAKRRAEIRPLLRTGDFFRKIVITGGNEREWMDEDGVTHIGVIPFMLNPTILAIDH